MKDEWTQEDETEYQEWCRAVVMQYNRENVYPVYNATNLPWLNYRRNINKIPY